uniref:Uncharacterized protein n=1 Tax=Seriola lalandi dorsalis TaxID=1841481 RepID=A0A3B4X4N9_SERLL
VKMIWIRVLSQSQFFCMLFIRNFTLGFIYLFLIGIRCSSLGKLLLVKVEKDPYLVLSEDEWYCSKIVVTTPEGDVILFPCYRWISRGELVELRGGRELHLRSQRLIWRYFTVFSVTLFVCFYRWKIMAEGLPHINSFNNLPIAFLPEYVTEHWMEDDFYGYQFLNGINPNMIKKCSELPPNFPVTDEMVKLFLEEDSSLQEVMEDGKIFLYDQKKMDGIPSRDYNGEPLHVSAGLCLFYLNPEDKLMPIAIQLHQQPSEDNPIFLPSDSETDWLLAKMFIKNADVVDHEAVHHLMKTHFLAEVYNMATLRCFPVIHPLYKLLIPHFRYTFNINMAGRESIFGTDGILKMVRLQHPFLNIPTIPIILNHCRIFIKFQSLIFFHNADFFLLKETFLIINISI